MELKGKVFNFLGDSITEGCGVSCGDNVFHQLIKRQYGMQHAYNYGVGGTRIARQITPSRVSTRHDLTFELRAEIMDKKADAVVVFGGTNDFGHGDALFGTADSEDIYTFCGAVNSLITKLQRDFSTADVVFMTPLHRLGENKPNPSSGKTLAEYAAAIRTICGIRGIPVIDLFAIEPIDPADEGLFPDGLHPNDKGHSVMAQVIAEELLKL